MNKELSDHNALQIDQAARFGCISGILEEWPELDVALRKYNIILPQNTIGITLQEICKLLIKHKKLKKKYRKLKDGPDINMTICTNGVLHESSPTQSD